jgi:hypothetical protein
MNRTFFAKHARLVVAVGTLILFVLGAGAPYATGF